MRPWQTHFWYFVSVVAVSAALAPLRLNRCSCAGYVALHRGLTAAKELARSVHRRL